MGSGAHMVVRVKTGRDGVVLTDGRHDGVVVRGGAGHDGPRLLGQLHTRAQ